MTNGVNDDDALVIKRVLASSVSHKEATRGILLQVEFPTVVFFFLGMHVFHSFPPFSLKSDIYVPSPEKKILLHKTY